MKRATQLQEEVVRLQLAKDAAERLLAQRNDERDLHKRIADDINKTDSSSERNPALIPCSLKCGGLYLPENLPVSSNINWSPCCFPIQAWNMTLSV